MTNLERQLLATLRIEPSRILLDLDPSYMKISRRVLILSRTNTSPAMTATLGGREHVAWRLAGRFDPEGGQADQWHAANAQIIRDLANGRISAATFIERHKSWAPPRPI